MLKRMLIMFSLITLAAAAMAGDEAKPKLAPPTPQQVDEVKAQGRYLAVITLANDKKIEIVLEGAEMPYTTANFVNLARAKFFDGLTFHRVVPNFVIQGGDPNGNGMGGPGYEIKLEINKALRHKKGAISMARTADPDSAGSQFFITLAATPHLDGGYAVFGWVKGGMDAVEAVKQGEKMKSVTVEPYKGDEPNPLK